MVVLEKVIYDKKWVERKQENRNHNLALFRPFGKSTPDRKWLEAFIERRDKKWLLKTKLT